MVVESRTWGRGERAGAAVYSAAMLAAVLSPLLQYRRPKQDRVDGFPLSWYPMFSTRRRQKVVIAHAVGVTAAGQRQYLPTAAYGPGGLNQVRRQLNRTVLKEQRPEAYAAALARRVARRSDCRGIVRVEVLATRFDLDRCFLDRTVCGKQTLLAAADVPGAVVAAVPVDAPVAPAESVTVPVGITDIPVIPTDASACADAPAKGVR